MMYRADIVREEDPFFPTRHRTQIRVHALRTFRHMILGSCTKFYRTERTHQEAIGAGSRSARSPFRSSQLSDLV